jgi:DNA-binding response OmpR family regulator
MLTTDNQIIKRILIAEDDKPIAKALQLKLEHSGFAVVVVNDGEEASKAIETEDFSIILLDLMMPKKDGFTFLAELKARPDAKAATPVIILSNLSQEGDIQKAKDLGAAGYFVKSDIPLVEIVNNVKRILEI